jgi:FtsZ-binding cell division protein ZapB
MNADEEVQTGNFHLMRQRLANRLEESAAGEAFSNSVLGPTQDEINQAKEKIRAMEIEKEFLKTENYKIKGEVTTLRRDNDKLKEEQQTANQSK